jgi:hypothetical protein
VLRKGKGKRRGREGGRQIEGERRREGEEGKERKDLFYLLLDPQKHIQVSREFKDKVVEPILKVSAYCHQEWDMLSHMTVVCSATSRGTSF